MTPRPSIPFVGQSNRSETAQAHPSKMQNSETDTKLAPSFFRRECNAEVDRLCGRIGYAFAANELSDVKRYIARISEITATCESYASICADLNRSERGLPEQSADV